MGFILVLAACGGTASSTSTPAPSTTATTESAAAQTTIASTESPAARSIDVTFPAEDLDDFVPLIRSQADSAVREADAVARAGRGGEAPIREAHPELCFTVLAGGRPMGHYKKTEQGHEERLAVLARHYRPARELVRRALERGHPK